MVYHSALVTIALSVACSRTEAFKPPPLTRASLVVKQQQRPTSTRAEIQKATSSLFGSFPFSKSMEKATPAPVAEPRGGVETVKSYFRHWNEREMEQAVALFSEDCVYEDTLYPRQFKGRPALKKHLLKVANALPESFSFVLDEISDGGNTIGVQWHVESNGAQLPFTRGCSVYKLDPATGLIKSGFDVPEPPVKSGSVSLAILSAASSIIDSPKRAIALGAFLFYCWFVFLSDVAPGYNALALDPATWQEVKDLSLNFWLALPFFSPESAPVIHPVLEGVFNFLLAWAALFAGFLVDGRVSNKPQSKNAFLPYVVGMQFLTNAVLLPWFLVRPTESQYRKLYSEVKSFAPLNKAEAFGESRLLPIVFGVVGLASLAWAFGGRPEYGLWGERWGSFIELAGTDRLTFSFLVDLAYFAYFQHWLLKDDAARRGYTGSLTLDSNVPFFGLLYWLVTRPPLPGVTESKVLSETKGKEGAPAFAQSAAPLKPVVSKQK